MFVKTFLKLIPTYAFGLHIVEVIVGIHIPQEIPAIDMLIALKPSF